MSSRKTASKVNKRFACTFEGCNRAFTRQEHLHRHSQNHAGGDFTCTRCRAHFKRQDLLTRHIARHEQKDAEGGSLMTRKRVWKSVDGSIVTQRPPSEGNDAADGDNHAMAAQCLPVSPPLSGTGNDSAQSSGPGFESSNQSLQTSGDLHMADVPHSPSYDFWNVTFQAELNATLQADSDNVDHLYEDAFNPDTGMSFAFTKLSSSFNMPFTTMNNYNWLFDLDLGNSNFSVDNIDHSIFIQSLTESQEGIETRDLTISNPNLDFPACDTHLQPVMENTMPPLQALQHGTLDPGLQQPPQFPEGVSGSRTATRDEPDPMTEQRSLPQAYPSTRASSMSSGNYQHRSGLLTPLRPSVPDTVERPMTLLNSKAKLPRLDAVSRTNILQLIENIRPTTPDGQHVSASNPLLSLSSLQTYSDMFFTNFNAAYPLIHYASFDPSGVDTLLLLSILLIGATYCDRDTHQLSVCIHDVLRPQIFAHYSFNARPELWMLQTILLTECFGKSRAGQKQHDMSHLFHGLLINLIRRSDCQTVPPEKTTEIKGNLEDEWTSWINREQKKRLALLCFMWDTQHAVLFCQSLCMSAFELRCALPCDQNLWEAESAENWQSMRKIQKPPLLYLTVLKSYLSAQTPIAARKLNALSRVLILHGLMSVSWDMERRDQTSLGFVDSNVLGDWRLRLASAYDVWKADFDAYTMTVKQSLSSNTSAADLLDSHIARREFAKYDTVNSALYHAAHVILFSSFLDLQIFAGAKHILGRPVRRLDYDRSRQAVKRWANEQGNVACKAAWHASHIIRDAVINLEDFDAGGLFIHPWCLYLASIVIWGFHHARPRDKVGGMDDHNGEEDDEMIWDAQADMNALISSMTSGSPEQILTMNTGHRSTRTAGLNAVISTHLGRIRWAVVHDGMLVLKGLVPWRVIGEAPTSQ